MTTTTTPIWDNIVRLRRLKENTLGAYTIVEWRYKELEEFHCRFNLLRCCIRTSFFTDFSLATNVTILQDMRGFPLYDCGKVVVRLQRKIRKAEKKIDPAVDRAKVLLQEYLDLKAIVAPEVPLPTSFSFAPQVLLPPLAHTNFDINAWPPTPPPLKS